MTEQEKTETTQEDQDSTKNIENTESSEDEETSEDLGLLEDAVYDKVSSLYAKKIYKDYKTNHPDASDEDIIDTITTSNTQSGPLGEVVSAVDQFSTVGQQIKSQFAEATGGILGVFSEGSDDENTTPPDVLNDAEINIKTFVLGYLKSKFKVFGVNIGAKMKEGAMDKFITDDIRKDLKALRKELSKKEKKEEDVTSLLEEKITSLEAALGGVSTTSTTQEASSDATDTKVEVDNSSEREKIENAIDEVLEEDKKKHIEYVWGGEDPEIEGGVDCSGLVDYVYKKAGLGVSRTIAGEYMKGSKEIKRVVGEDEISGLSDDVAKEKVSENLKDMDFQKGDLLFWNSLDPKYKFDAGPVPKTTIGNEIYRIHHVAFVDKVNDDGTIDIVQSSGSQGVNKATINPVEWIKDKGQLKSELYIGKMDYPQYFADNPMSKNNDAQAA